MDQKHGTGEAGEEGRFLQRRVTAPDDGDVLLAEEETVTGRAPGQPVPGETLLLRKPEPAIARSHGQDDGARAVLPTGAVPDDLDVAAEVHRYGVVGHQLGAETLGLAAHRVHELRSHDPVREAGEVFHVGRAHQRAAGGHRPLQQDRLQPRSGGVDGGAVARGAGADDDQVAGLAGRAGHVGLLRCAGLRDGQPILGRGAFPRCLSGCDDRVRASTAARGPSRGGRRQWDRRRSRTRRTPPRSPAGRPG